jgi:hypothetical protein
MDTSLADHGAVGEREKAVSFAARTKRKHIRKVGMSSPAGCTSRLLLTWPFMNNTAAAVL